MALGRLKLFFEDVVFLTVSVSSVGEPFFTVAGFANSDTTTPSRDRVEVAA